ncbi:MAG: hypothetical protein B6244_12835 [Candidatus Cloacimonetes bacterium 4572_55]|nr:MAG: hypothetical protein B6244_12835 [Candidatus Cloacimonetes bacterium 4572_55]
MNFFSIRFQFIAGSILPLVIFIVVGLYWLLSSYNTNIQIVSELTVARAETEFKNIEMQDINKLSATLTALIENNEIKDKFLEQDREKLTEFVTPLFEDLRERFQVTHWYFIYPDSSKICFLRVHKPCKYGDVITRLTFEHAVEKKTFGVGKELGKTAFALRVVHPYYGASGELIGYMELGEEIDHFFGIMKSQTKEEYGLLVLKKYIDKKKWVSSRKLKGLEDNWEKKDKVIVVNTTSEDENLFDFDGDIESIPDGGLVLSQITKNDSVYIKGIFPVYDAAMRKVGGTIVLSNITPIYNQIYVNRRDALVVIFFTLLVSLAIAYFASSSINRSLRQAMRLVEKVAHGDLSVKFEITSRDELGKMMTALLKMIASLRTIIEQIVYFSNLAGRLSSNAHQINSGVEDQSNTAIETSAAMEGMSSSTHEMANSAKLLSDQVMSNLASILDVANNAKDVSASSESAVNEARASSEVVKQTVKHMKASSEIMDHIVTVIGRFDESSKQINNIVGVIDDIARQTNLLALNAAIEAARAGDHGKGFAVVASEVRNLAERSASSAKEIKYLIRNIQSDTGKVIDASRQGSNNVDKGVQLATQAGSALDRIVSAVDAVNQMMADISKSTSQQAKSSENINKMAELMRLATDEQIRTSEKIVHYTENVTKIALNNTTLSIELNDMTGQLSKKAEELHGLTSSFKVD